MKDKPFEFVVPISDADIDHLGHVNNASYIRWTQQAVVAHWEYFSTEVMVRKYFWIALRHEIDYRMEAFRDDALIAVVTLVASTKVRVIYETAINRGPDLIASVISTWCCINPVTRKPERMGEDIIDTFQMRAAPADAE